VKKLVAMLGFGALTLSVAGCSQAGQVREAEQVREVEWSSKSPSKTKFWDVLSPRGEGGSQIAPPATLAEAYDDATATVAAEVTGVRPGRVIRGEAGDLYWVVVALKVNEVLNGQLEPSLNGKTEMEFAAAWDPGTVDTIVDGMRETLPTGQAIWLIKWEGEFKLTKPLPPGADPAAFDSSMDKTKYVMVHPDVGAITEDAGRVVSLTAWEGTSPRGALAEAQQLGSIEAVVQHARNHG
jgi:hypothetical protein